MGLSLAVTKKASKYASEEEEVNFIVLEAYGVDEESYEGESALKVDGMGEIVLECPFMRTGWEGKGR